MTPRPSNKTSNKITKKMVFSTRFEPWARSFSPKKTPEIVKGVFS